MLQVGDPLMGFYVTKLTSLFLQPVNTDANTTPNAQTKDIKPKDKFSWIASILLNVTSVRSIIAGSKPLHYII